MAERKGEWVGIVYNLATRKIEQVIVPSGPGAAATLDRHRAKNVTVGKSEMRKITRAAYDGFRSNEELARALMLA